MNVVKFLILNIEKSKINLISIMIDQAQFWVLNLEKPKINLYQDRPSVVSDFRS